MRRSLQSPHPLLVGVSARVIPTDSLEPPLIPGLQLSPERPPLTSVPTSNPLRPSLPTADPHPPPHHHFLSLSASNDYFVSPSEIHASSIGPSLSLSFFGSICEESQSYRFPHHELPYQAMVETTLPNRAKTNPSLHCFLSGVPEEEEAKYYRPKPADIAQLLVHVGEV